jgi:glucose/arabinose dehydrogenase
MGSRGPLTGSGHWGGKASAVSRGFTPRLAALLAIVVVAAACFGDQQQADPPEDPATAVAPPASPEPTAEAPPPTPSPSPEPPPPPPPAPMPSSGVLEGVELEAVPFVDVPELTGMAWRPDDPGAYLITQPGMIHRVVDDQLDPEPVLDLTAEVSEILPGSERGLLGIAFDPEDGRMFLNYTDHPDGHTHVVSYEVRDGRALPDSRREVLYQEQPGPGHNGGHLAFDEDGHLFISLGDGGGSNGRDAQDMTKLHGAILRITPNRDGPGYEVPDDNPFVDEPDVLPELWAKGLRNPWRFSIDHPTGDLWIGDVGDNEIEEINHMPAGEKGLNFGWYYFEGTRQRHGDAPPDLTPPVYEYPHSVGPAVIGGYVYRGSAVADLEGAYVFADLSGIVWAMGADDVVRLPVQLSGAVTSFGEDPDGELYLLTLREGGYRLVSP